MLKLDIFQGRTQIDSLLEIEVLVWYNLADRVILLIPRVLAFTQLFLVPV